MSENVFSKLSDDVVLKIFFNLEDDPRYWTRLACVCTKSLMHNICWKTKCSQTIPSLLSTSTAPPGGWAALHKLAVCCPGLLHAGVLLENSDFGLERELGPDENYKDSNLFQLGQTQTIPSSAPTKIDASRWNQGIYNASDETCMYWFLSRGQR